MSIVNAPRLIVFDLDHTLLDGDSDEIWCEFLLANAQLPREFTEMNQRMVENYKAGTASARDFSGFYVSTLKGRSPLQWQSLRQTYFETSIVPRISDTARQLVRRSQLVTPWVILSTATNRFLVELTAAHFGFKHLLATECEVSGTGEFTGAPTGVLNMREGKVERLQSWIHENISSSLTVGDADVTFYSDSTNDIPLLSAVNHPIVVDPGPALSAHALSHHWPILHLYRKPQLAQ